MQPEKIDLSSATISEEKLAQLRDLLPEVFHEGKINFDELKNALGDYVEEDPTNERFGLRWSGKSKLQQVISTPSVGTLVPQPEESVDWDDTGNIIIEGDNLEVLKLLQKSYAGKVKMIYIDPPYNTGNDFVYPDKYASGLDTYLEFTGQTDEDGKKLASNSDTSGRYHANWLNMMYPRLYLARNLLRQDGLIFVSIDEAEIANLKSCMDQIFGTENFRNAIAVRRGIKNVQSQFEDIASLSQGHEYILLYSRSMSERLPKLTKLTNSQLGKWDTFWRGTDRPTMRYELFGQRPDSGQWRWSQDRSAEANENYQTYLSDYADSQSLDEYFQDHLQATGMKLNFVRINDEKVVQYYVPPQDSMLLSDNWMDLTLSGSVTEFDTEKSVRVMMRMIGWISSQHEIVLDFFAGSGTTGHAVMQQNAEDGGNRKYILVQLPEPMDPKTLDDGTQLNDIADITRERVRRAGVKIKSELAQSQGGGGGFGHSAGNSDQNSLPQRQHDAESLDIGFRAYKLAPSNFQPWDGDNTDSSLMTSARQASFMPQNQQLTLEQRILQAADHLNPAADDLAILTELLLKLGEELTVPVEKLTLAGKTVYAIDGNVRLICLERDVTLDVIREMAAREPGEIICLDAGFPDDQTKVNAGQIIATQAQHIEGAIAFKVV